MRTVLFDIFEVIFHLDAAFITTCMPYLLNLLNNKLNIDCAKKHYAAFVQLRGRIIQTFNNITNLLQHRSVRKRAQMPREDKPANQKLVAVT